MLSHPMDQSREELHPLSSCLLLAVVLATFPVWWPQASSSLGVCKWMVLGEWERSPQG